MINQKLNNTSNALTGYTLSLISKYSPLNTINVEVGDLIIEFNNISINNFGELNIKLASKYELTDYINRLQTEKDYQIKFYSFKSNTIVDTVIRFNNSNQLGIKRIIPIIDKLEFIKIGGLILTPLTQNIISLHMKQLKKYLKYDKILKAKVVVANILPDSVFRLSENINRGDIITKINGIDVSTIDDINKLLKEQKPDDKFITLETDDKLIDTISIETII